MKQLIIFLFCALTIQCFGQNDKVHYELGEPYHCKHTYKHYSFETTQAIISIKKKTGEKIVIQLFDPINLTLSNQEEYDFGSFGPNFYLENVEKIGDKILFIYYTKKSNNVRLYSKTIDPKTGKFIGQPKLLINFVRKGSAYSLFNIKKSKNEQTLLIYHE